LRKTLRWSLLTVVIAAIGAIIWHYTRPDPVEIVIRPVETGQVDKIVANTRAGTVEACRRAKLSPSIGGQIAKLPVKEGDSVTAGQLLLELWNNDLVAQTALAQSEVTSAESRAKSACLQAEVAQREADRQIKLRRSGSASEEQADKTITRAQSLQAECKATRAVVETSRARVGVAKANLDRTRLTAPFSGIIAQINGELSEFVTPSPIGIPTPPAVDIVDISCFYVTAPIDEVDAAAIDVGLPAIISLDAFGDRHFSGRVRRIAPFVLDREKQARTVDVEVEFTRTEDFKHLLAGYSADVEIVLDARKNTLRIPTHAILDGKRVFVYLPDRKVIQERSIQAGLSNWEYTEVISGLKPGEQVVVNVDRSGIADEAPAVVMKETP
ncbi:MAG: efflux RND transporter periplasmic adaptor subunit, partial [Desulfobacterales bacterium]